MLIQHSKHFEAFPVVHQPLIFEEEMQGTVLNCHPDLTFPVGSGFHIPGVGDEGIIQA